MLKRMAKDSFLLRAVMLVLVLLLVSMYIASGYLAKYISDGDNDDAAGVASYSFNINNSTALNLDLSSVNAPGTSQTYTFTVASPNTNEVARHYEVLVKTTNNLPLTLTLKEGVTTLDATSDTVATGIAYDISTSGNVASGSAFSKTYSLIVAWPANQNSTSYAGVVDTVSLEVTGTQID